MPTMLPQPFFRLFHPKLKCVVSADGGACVRCATRKEECRFKTRAHVMYPLAHYTKINSEL